MGAALADAARALPRAAAARAPRARARWRRRRRSHAARRCARTALFDQDAPADAAEEAGPVPLHEERRPRSQRLVPLVVAFAVDRWRWSAAASRSPRRGGGTVAVPSVVGFNLDDAKIRVATDGLTVAVVERNADDPKGVVIAQSPAGGSFAGDSTRVRLVVSRGPPPVPIPDVRTLSPEDAQARLEEAGFLVTVERPNNETVPYNDVIDTDPPSRREAAARLRDHVAREQRSRAGADPRHREHELRRGRASAHRARASRCSAATTSATPCPSTR